MARQIDSDALLDAELRQLLERLKLAFRRARGAAGEGLRRAGGRPGRNEFADFRDYEPGDDLRDLDWPAYARLEKLFIKEYASHSTEPITLLLDASASMACGQPDKWRFARRLALALAFLALLGKHKVRLLLLGENRWLGPFSGPEKIEQLAARLQQASTAPQADLATALRSQARSLAGHGRYMLISDLWADEALQQVLLAAQGPARAWSILQVLSGDEISPQLNGPLRLRDAEGGEALEFQVDRPLLQAYLRALEAHLHKWRTFCQRYRLRHVRLDTRQPLEAALLAELREGGLVH